MDPFLIASTLKNIAKELGEPTTQLLTESDPNGTLGELALIRDGYKLERLPGPIDIRRKHRFSSVKSFGEWLRRHANWKNTEILYNEETGMIVACLDPSNPNSAFVECRIEMHPRAAEWNGMFETAQNQRGLWKFVRSHLADFSEALDNDGDSLGSYGLILARTLQNLVVKKSGSFQQTINNAGNTVVTASDGKTEFPSELPASFFINIPLLRDITVQDGMTGDEVESSHRLEVFLEIETEGGIEMTLSCPDFDVAMTVERERAMDCLKRILAGSDEHGFLVGLGNLQLQTVQRLVPQTE